jgi:hypothetical protein
MNLFKKLLVVVMIAATGMMGSAQAQNTFNLDTLSPTVQTRTDIFGAGSFADIFNFTVDATHHTVSTSTIQLAPDGTVSSTSVTGLKLELFSGFNPPVSGATPLITGLDLNAELLTPGDFSVRVSGVAGPAGGGFSFSTAANPEPAEWMLLLAGLVVVGFMARRKASLVAG